MARRSSPPLSWGNWKWSARGRRISGMDTPATPLSLYVRLDLSSLLICATFKLGHCEIQIRPLQRCFFGSVSCLRRTLSSSQPSPATSPLPDPWSGVVWRAPKHGSGPRAQRLTSSDRRSWARSAGAVRTGEYHSHRSMKTSGR